MKLNAIQPDPRTWDAFVEAQGGHLLQTHRWGALKSAFGWSSEIVALAEGNRIMAGALLLFRRLPLGLGSIAYLPRGPVVDWSDEASLSVLLDVLDETARGRRAFFLKVEPDERDSVAMRERLVGLGFRSSPQTIQPPRTIVIDITGSEDSILARMNQGTRRKIRTAYRKEVVIRQGEAGDLESFNWMMGITGRRGDFGVHSPAYYQKTFELFAPEYATLLMASYKGQDLAGLMAFACGERAWYLHGASSNEERDRMPAYALQWEAIRWARERGCTTYDMWGIPDEDEKILEAQFQRRQDGLWGVYGFKRGFCGQIVRAVGAWDRVYKPSFYAAYRVAIGSGTTRN